VDLRGGLQGAGRSVRPAWRCARDVVAISWISPGKIETTFLRTEYFRLVNKTFYFVKSLYTEYLVKLFVFCNHLKKSDVRSQLLAQFAHSSGELKALGPVHGVAKEIRHGIE
jgi:hypothetical protein